MKTDAQLKKDLEAELDWDPAIQASRVGVTVLDGVVALTGHLGAFAENAALARYADDEATRIEVLVEDGTATLRGTVNPWAEQGVVQRAAWSAPGIQRVFNELKVLL